jgi:hypothetical protein
MTRGLPSPLWSWSSLTHTLHGWWCQERHWRTWKLMLVTPNTLEWSCRRCGRTWSLARGIIDEDYRRVTFAKSSRAE